MTHSLRRLLCALALAALPVPVLAQGVIVPTPKFQAFDDNGDPCNLCKVYVYAAGTSTPATVYSDVGLSVPWANPITLDAAGRASIYASPTVSYKYVLTTSAGVTLWTIDNVAGPLSNSVLSITVANARGLQIARAGADAGLSVASTGGSGKTWGLLSNTVGEMRLQDDADASPRFQLGSGDNASVVTSGTFTVSGGLFNVTGFGAHMLSSGGAGGNTLSLRNTTAGTVNYAQFVIANDVSNAAGGLGAFSSTWTTSNQNVQDGVTLTSTRPGGLSISAENAAGAIRFYAGGVGASADFTIDSGGRLTSTTQPGFLAYNSTADLGLAVTSTVEFDTEIYDTAGNFAAHTFTAPVTGIYQLCVAVYASASSGGSIRLVTSNRAYWIGATTSTLTTQSGCVFADMDAADTASVSHVISGGTEDNQGGGSPVLTYFSGRLVP